jgi:putative tryptophan/tyrosine transport system substrate-binding protein
VKRREFIALVGAATASSLTADAQQPMPVIGYLSVGSPETDNIPGRLGAFRRGLNEAGYVEGRNVAIEYRGAEGRNDRLPALAADLVRLQVAVIVAHNNPTTLAAKAATSTIPIVCTVGMDPVQSGLVASFNRPGGNITGVALQTAELMGKRLELLHELVPMAADVAVLVNPTNPTATESESSNLQGAARALGLELHFLQATTPNEIEAAFETLVELPASALVVSADAWLTSQRAQIVGLAARHAVPAIYAVRWYPEAGGLMSYGVDFADAYRQMGLYTGKILRGERAADLPVQQMVKVELVINLKTAKALGLTIPPIPLARADEVIE